ncbi:MAG: hypothetical protein ACYCU0_12725 [Solirubrobacteraceae bacterium]
MTLQAHRALLAWADYQGTLHLGEPGSGAQVTLGSVSEADSPAAGGISTVDGRLFWAAGGIVQMLDPSNGRVRDVIRGEAVIAAARGPHILVVSGDRRLIEFAVPSLAVVRRVPVPSGWRAYPDVGSVAGGLVVDRARGSRVLGVLRLRSGRVVPVSGAPASGLPFSTYTSPHGRFSLIASVPARCVPMKCRLAIVNTATGATLRVASPLRHGFATGSAFSPNGRQLAIFLNTNDPHSSDGSSELAIVNTSSGALRLLPRVKMTTTEDAAWAAWLPGGHQLLAGALSSTYLVEPASSRSRPFYFDGGATRFEGVTVSPDLNFSTVVLEGLTSATVRARLAQAAPPHER